MKYYLICYMSQNERIHTCLCVNEKLKDIVKTLQSVYFKIISISEIQKEIFDILEELQ